jgi:hypothetical protein
VDAATDHESQVKAYTESLLQLLRDGDHRRALGDRCRARVEEHFGLQHMMSRRHAAFLAADQLRRSSPRGVVPEGVARACANYAIENTRLQQLADGLWLQRNAGQAVAVVAGERTPSWRAMVLRFCTRLEPAYAWGLHRGWTWLMPLRRRVRGWVMGSERMRVVSAEP